MSKRIDLTGQVFGRWKVLEFDKKRTRETGQTYWICQCSCEKKTIKSVRATHLKSGQSTSCGCYRNEQVYKANMKDITGQTFGFLTAIEPTDKRRCTSVVWKCYCSNCGSYCYKAENDLQSGTISCGCINSKGELKLKQLLTSLNIPFKEQYTFDDLKGKDNRHLRFDFGILNEDQSLRCLIEYQGSQHYYYSPEYGRDGRFERQQFLDQKKKDYCKENNIQLLEICYRDYDKLNEEYLKNLIYSESMEVSK